MIRFRLLQLLLWTQLHAPVLFPILDKVLHPFGICTGH